MPIDSLFKAFAMFEKSVGDAAKTHTVMTANKKVQSIRDSAMKEEEKQAALRTVSQDLTMRFAAQGADPNEVKAIAQSFEPTASQEAEKQRKFISKENSLNRDAQLQLAGLKAGAAGTKPLAPGELKQVQDFDKTHLLGADLLQQATENKGFFGLKNKVPGVQGFRAAMDPKFADLGSQIGRWFDSYRHEITGAQATVEEMKMLRDNTPVMDEPYGNFNKKMRTILRVGEKVKSRYLKNLQLAGRRTGGLTAAEDQGGATPADIGMSLDTDPPSPVKPGGAFRWGE